MYRGLSFLNDAICDRHQVLTLAWSATLTDQGLLQSAMAITCWADPNYMCTSAENCMKISEGQGALLRGVVRARGWGLNPSCAASLRQQPQGQKKFHPGILWNRLIIKHKDSRRYFWHGVWCQHWVLMKFQVWNSHATPHETPLWGTICSKEILFCSKSFVKARLEKNASPAFRLSTVKWHANAWMISMPHQFASYPRNGLIINFGAGMKVALLARVFIQGFAGSISAWVCECILSAVSCSSARWASCFLNCSSGEGFLGLLTMLDDTPTSRETPDCGALGGRPWRCGGPCVWDFERTSLEGDLPAGRPTPRAAVTPPPGMTGACARLPSGVETCSLASSTGLAFGPLPFSWPISGSCTLQKLSHDGRMSNEFAFCKCNTY